MTTISRTGRVLRRLVRLSCRRPWLTVAIALALAIVSIAYTAMELRFKTSGRDVLPQRAGYVQRYVEYARDFGELEDIVVVVEARSFEAAKAYAARLVQELKESPVKFPRAHYRIDPKRFEGRHLLYLDTDKLREIRDMIFDHQDFMESFAADPSLAQLLEGINTELASAFVAHAFDIGLSKQESPVDTRFLRSVLDQIAARLDRPAPYRSPWGTLFSLGDDPAPEAGYFLSDDKSLLFVLLETPKGVKGSFVGDRAAIEAIRGAIATLRRDFPSVNAGVTGAPALSNDEMSSAFHDSEIATLIASALTLLVMLLAFWRVGKPLLLLVVLNISLMWAMGVTTLVVGHLTIFSVMFISIVIGIGIDYGIYILFRYEEEIFLGRNLIEALELTAARAGPAMAMSALTAGGTFLVLVFTQFQGIKELGFIAGVAILLSGLAMITLFPALLVLVDRRHADRPRNQRPRAHQLEQIHVPLLDQLTRHPVAVLCVAGAATALSLLAVPRVGFDYNLLNLQAKGTESVAWEKRILSSTGRSGFNALASADSLEELRRKQLAFQRLPSVSEVDSVLRLIPDEQAEKAEIIKTFAPIVAPVRVGRSSPVDMERLTRAVRDLKRRLDVAAKEAGAKLPEEVRELRTRTTGLLRQLEKADRDMAEAVLTHLQAQLYRDFQDKFHGLQRNLNPQPVTARDVPEELQRKFVGASGRFLIQVHPRVDIWERKGAEQFVRELRAVDPDVTGSPVITYEAIRLMEGAYLQGTLYAFALVAALTFWMIRRWRMTLMALLPLVLGLVWTIGLMHVFDLKFTLANVWGLPLLIGASAEFGLQIVLRFLEGRQHGGPLIARSTVMGVALSGITTIVGFGSLMIADHQGIFGLGLLLTLGSACGLIASLLVLPVILMMLPIRAGVPAPSAPPTPAG